MTYWHVLASFCAKKLRRNEYCPWQGAIVDATLVRRWPCLRRDGDARELGRTHIRWSEWRRLHWRGSYRRKIRLRLSRCRSQRDPWCTLRAANAMREHNLRSWRNARIRVQAPERTTIFLYFVILIILIFSTFVLLLRDIYKYMKKLFWCLVMGLNNRTFKDKTDLRDVWKIR